MAEHQVDKRERQGSGNKGTGAPDKAGKPPDMADSAPDKADRKKPHRRRRAGTEFWLQIVGTAIIAVSASGAIRDLYGASREGNASDVLTAYITAFALLLAITALAQGAESKDVVEQTWLWLKARGKTAIYSTVSGIIVVVAVWFLIKRHNVALAGLVVMAAAVVRLVATQSIFRKWEKPVEQLRLHVATEVFFHCFALWGLTAGLLLEVAATKNLETAPRITITATLSLALLVAVNKATARTRKLCTAIDGQISDVLRTVDALRAKRVGLDELRREAFESVAALDRMLRTHLNTGYKLTGTGLIPRVTREELVRDLRGSITDSVNEEAWPQARGSLELIQIACSRWTDAMA
ncbi:hypothetical protein ABZV61_38215 [Streptomyces sp900116325]|uniref:Uncharacterized protein n=1 Tax=Streptomyces sp. 900116325 TaxID=3154295 RepID=A0ABV2UM15_9ACTN